MRDCLRLAFASALLRLACSALLVLLFCGSLQAQTSAAALASEIEALDQSLIAASSLRPTAADQEPTSSLSDLAAHRRDLLLQLMNVDPAAAYRLALSPDTLSNLPDQVTALVENDVELQGTLEVLYEDLPQRGRFQYFLETDAGRLQLHFAYDQPTGMLTGTAVHLRGKAIGTDVLLDSAINSLSADITATDLTPSMLSSPFTFGNQPSVVLLVNFQDDTSQPVDIATAQDVVFNGVDAFYRENSQNQTWVTGDVFGYFTIPLSVDSCNLPQIQVLTDQAVAAASIDLTKYKHIIYAFPSPRCDFVAASYLGGNRVWTKTPLLIQVVAHEMGHNFGLYHSHALNCSPAIIGNNCSSIEYGDIFDVMGDTLGAHFNAYQKEKLGYLSYGTSLPITAVAASGTYDIAPYENLTGSKALKILKQTDPNSGAKTYYYVEYRQLLGFDTSLQPYPASTAGVLIHTGSDSIANSSYLLDMNPQTTVFDDAALAFGQTYVDPNTGLAISALSADDTAAHVKVVFGGEACVPRLPSITVNPASQSALAGTTLSYLLTFTNTDSATCNPEVLTLTNSAPGGWTGSLDNTSLTLAPGATGTATFTVTSSATANGGNYFMYVRAKTTPGGFTNAGQIIYSIPVSFTLSLDNSSLTVAQGGTVSTNLTSTIGGTFSAPVTLSLSGVPAGVTASLSPASFDAPGSGKSTLSFNVSANAAAGNYPITVTGTGGGFTIQVPLTLTINTAGNLSISASPLNVSVIQGSNNSTTITSTIAGSFSSPVALSVAGLPTGVSASFMPSTLPAPGSGPSSLTFTATSNAPLGTYPLTVTAIGGGFTRTASVSLTVTGTPPPPPPPGSGTLIPQTNWKLKFVDSQESACGLFVAAFAFDGKPNTMWQTQSCYGTTPPPHEIQIDLGGTYPVSGFRYLPRQDKASAGKIASFEFYVSTDGITWGTPAVTGVLITDPADIAEKQILFNQSINARFVRLRALTEVNGGLTTTVAELNVLQSTSAPPPPVGDFSLTAFPAGVSVVQGQSGSTIITTSLTGMFSSAIGLSISGLQPGVSAAFTPNSIAAPGSGKSTLTFTVDSTASVGTYAVNITGAGGGITHVLPLMLTVTAGPPPPPPPPGSGTPIPQAAWRLKYVDSQETACGLFAGSFAFDGKPSTIWQTQSCLGATPAPHEIQIDLAASYKIVGFRYLPRQDNLTTGKIASFEFYVSTDGITWGSPAASGVLITNPSDKTEKQILLGVPITGRYVRLRALTEVNGGPATSVAELNVLQ